jgi:hypothetical protein
MSKINLYTTGTPTASTKLIGTNVDSANETENFSVSDLLSLKGYTGVPSASDAPGTAGQYAADSTYFYICRATDTWMRVAIATW